jgi:hypothetical protein
MRRSSICCCAWLLLLTPIQAGEPAESKSSSATPAEQYRAIEAEFNAAQQEFMKLYREAKTNEERQDLREKNPSPLEYANRMLALAKSHPDDPAAVDALTWVVVRGRGSETDRALEALGDHVESDRLGRVCQRLAIMGLSPTSEQFLRRVLEKNSSHEVQASACLGLAQGLKQQAGQNEAKDIAPEKMLAEAEQLFERVIKDFGDVKTPRGTAAEAARGELFELRNLALGKVAPEIEGEDLDGQAFKLSDYRGKVVMLDFWGNW